MSNLTAEFVIDDRQPGNNCIVAGTRNKAAVDSFKFAPDGVTLRGFSPKLQQIIEVPSRMHTPMLTVWRTLWAELDSMEAPDPRPAPAGDGPFDGAGHGNDDVEIDPGNLPLGLMSSSMEAACVRVRQLPTDPYDVKDDVDFVHNLPFLLFGPKGTPKRDIHSARDFWVVHLIGAYECETTIDNDPDTEDGLFGYDSGLMSDRPIYVFLETARDIVANTPGSVSEDVYVSRGVLHEALHQFLGPHSAGPNAPKPENPVADEGVMDYIIARTGSAAQNLLTPHQVRYIQKITSHPGYR